MEELIRKQDAIEAINIWLYCDKDERMPADVIKALPPVQSKRGKWVKISPANIYECSKCGKHVMTNDISAYDFCHGCGADMRGGEE